MTRSDSIALPRPAGGASARDGQLSHRTPLPSWPLTVTYGLLPLWWVTGLIDLVWFPVAVVMAGYLVRRRRVRAPWVFAIWAVFFVWMAASMVMLDSTGRLVGFLYRLSLYAAFTVLFVYVYNGRERLTSRYLAGLLTWFWVTTVAFGYLALILPRLVLRTPMAYAIPSSIASNELVRQMVIRPMTQYNPHGYFHIAPRPSAPFLYTNNWGNVFSLLLPFVVAYLVMVRRERKFWSIAAVLPLSLIPAFLTLNRGMFLGLAVAVAYVALRLLLLGNARGMAMVAVLATLAAGVWVLVPAAQDRLQYRLENSSSTRDRLSLYRQVIAAVSDSPLLGQGAPRPSPIRGEPSVGTQGQIWQVLYSFGLPGATAFLLFFVVAVLLSARRRDIAGLLSHTVLLVGTMELLYYGVLPYGLPLMMIAAALALRGRDVGPPSPQGRSRSTAGGLTTVA